MINKIKDYFHFNKKERKGILLLSIILMAIVLIYYFSDWFKPNRTTDFTSFEQAIAKLEWKNESNPLVRQDSLFHFDPNTLEDKGWLALGLSAGKLSVLRNYQKHGGYFKQKEDLKRCYAIGESFYNKIKDYVVFPIKISSATDKTDFLEIMQVIELNSADSLSLIALKGIGPFYAHQIVQYRERLGGFVQMEQLNEIWGLEKLNIEQLKQQISIDTLVIKKININSASVEELGKHPYLTFKQARWIVNYRQQHGNYYKVDEILQIEPLSQEIFRKIAPYLTTNDHQ